MELSSSQFKLLLKITTAAKQTILLWHRYIDDVFLVWYGTPQLLDEFIAIMGQNSFNLSFTFNCATDKITFLDVTIFKDDQGNLSSGLFRKPTAGNTILHASS